MSTNPGQLILNLHDATGLQRQQHVLLTVYRDVYVERLNQPFFTAERFWKRLESYASRDGFRLVTGHVGAEVIGFTLGETLPAHTGWWRGFKGQVDPGLLVETGSRTFAVNELMVRSRWRRRGYAKALTSALLEGLQEERVTLLVRAENTPAYTAYRTWGFRVIGQVRPFDDSPVYEAMIKTLNER